MRHRPLPAVLMQCTTDVSTDLGDIQCGRTMRGRSTAAATIFVMLIAGSVPLASVGAERSPVLVLTQRDWTTSAGLFLDDCSSCGDPELRTLDPNWILDFAPGRYVEPLMLTGGIYLDLFPEKTYAISSWCDICSPAAHESGLWERDGRQLRLHVAAEVLPESDEIHWASFRRRFENYRTLEFFVTLKGSQIHSSILVPWSQGSAPNDSSVEIFLKREMPYSDWPAERERLLQEIKARSKE